MTFIKIYNDLTIYKLKDILTDRVFKQYGYDTLIYNIDICDDVVNLNIHAKKNQTENYLSNKRYPKVFRCIHNIKTDRQGNILSEDIQYQQPDVQTT